MSTTLTDLLERHFLPQVMPDIGPDYEGSFRIAIQWLEATAGHPPTLADATPANITAMQHAMADAGMGWSRIRQLKIRIGSLCKHAYRLGLVDQYESVPTIKVTIDSPAYLREVAAADTLAGWYRQNYREPLAERVKESRLNVYDKAVERFDRTFDRHVTLTEVSESMLTQFQRALEETGVKAFVIAKEPNAIRHILQSWNDELWPVFERKQKQTKPEVIGDVNPVPAALDKDKTELTLGEFLTHIYLVGRSVRKSTAVQLRIAASLFERWNGGSVLLKEIDETLVSRWLADYELSVSPRTGKKPTPKTVQGKRCAVMCIWRFAWVNDCVTDCPKPERVRSVKVPRKAPVAWTLDELKAILKACDDVSGHCGRTGFRKIDLDAIDMHPRQARQKFPEDEISSLASSLEAHGLIEPILVRPLSNGRFELVAGERRYRAATMAGWSEIPATVRDLDDKASLEMMMAENVHRRNLDPIELARGLAQLCRPVEMGGGGMNYLECDEIFGKGRSWTSRHLSLLKLPSLWQEKVRTKEITYSAAIALVPFADQPKVMAAIDRDMKKNPWAWHTLAEVTRSARLISERLQAEEDRKAAKAKPTGTTGDPSEATAEDTPSPSTRPGRPRVKNVRKQPASYRDEIRRLLFGLRTAVGELPQKNLWVNSGSGRAPRLW